VFWGDRDTVIPYSHAEALAPKEVEKDGFAHALATTLDQAIGSARFRKWVLVMQNSPAPETSRGPVRIGSPTHLRAGGASGCDAPSWVRIRRHVGSPTDFLGSTRRIGVLGPGARSTPCSSCSRSRYSSPATSPAAVSAVLTRATSSSESSFSTSLRVVYASFWSLVHDRP
jgi:hypothetical protein